MGMLSGKPPGIYSNRNTCFKILLNIYIKNTNPGAVAIVRLTQIPFPLSHVSPALPRVIPEPGITQ